MPKQITINVDEFNIWADQKWIEYASETVVGSESAQRLRLSVTPSKTFKVELGAKILYHGNSLNVAKQYYHDHQ